MTTVADVSKWLDGFAPRSHAESWDNVGLLWGDLDSPVSRVMTCLTVTHRTALEAVHEGANLIVSHHPVLFRPVKKVVASDPENGMLWPLARAGISVISPHTSFDNTEGGINDVLAGRLGLVDVSGLRGTASIQMFKVVVFAQEADREAVLMAAFSQGAGRIGAYQECSFAIPGLGTFFGGEESSPTVGKAGQRETVSEVRLEVLCASDCLAKVLTAIRAAHSYEEPAIDVYPLHPPAKASGVGSGRVGQLPVMSKLASLAAEVARVLGSPSLQYVGEPERAVSRVAIVCGAGDDFIADAIKVKADVLLTGEARFHRALEAEALGIGLIVAGHHATERPGVEALSERISTAFPALKVWASGRERDPLRLIDRSDVIASRKEPPGITPGVGRSSG